MKKTLCSAGLMSALFVLTFGLIGCSDDDPAQPPTIPLSFTPNLPDTVAIGTALAGNTPIGTFSTTEAGGTYGYKLVDGEGDTDNGLFVIDPATGVLEVSAVPIGSAAAGYKIRAQIKNTGTLVSSETSELAVTITIPALNFDPGLETGLKASNTNTLAEAVVATFDNVVGDGTGPYEYSLVPGNGSADNDKFEIDKGTLKVKDRVGLVTLAAGDYTVRVKIKDTGGTYPEAEKIITFTVGATVDISATYAVVSPISLSANSSVINTSFQVVHAATNPQNHTGACTYSILAGQDSSLFDIVATDGIVTFKAAQNNAAAYTITVRQEDTAGNFKDYAFTISITS